MSGNNTLNEQVEISSEKSKMRVISHRIDHLYMKSRRAMRLFRATFTE